MGLGQVRYDLMEGLGYDWMDWQYIHYLGFVGNRE